jgi:hypothetical protein
MSSTVTINVVALMSKAGLAAFFGLIVVLTLILLTLNKELISTSNSPRLQLLSRSLNFVIAPLLIVFAIMAAVQFLALLR